MDKILSTGATFSPCQTYRYTLERTWNPGQHRCAFIGFNPSTADAFEDDPTIRRCIGFARRWGFGSILMLNLFAFRSTDPKALASAIDPIGPMNDDAILDGALDSHRVVFAWGALASGHRDRVEYIERLLCDLNCVSIGDRTKGGFPRHPLYLKAATEPVAYFPTPPPEDER